jgi:hypothetical protein
LKEVSRRRLGCGGRGGSNDRKAEQEEASNDRSEQTIFSKHFSLRIKNMVGVW